MAKEAMARWGIGRDFAKSLVQHWNTGGWCGLSGKFSRSGLTNQWLTQLSSGDGNALMGQLHNVTLWCSSQTIFLQPCDIILSFSLLNLVEVHVEKFCGFFFPKKWMIILIAKIVSRNFIVFFYRKEAHTWRATRPHLYSKASIHSFLFPVKNMVMMESHRL